MQIGAYKRAVKARDGEFVVKDKNNLNLVCKGEFTSYEDAKRMREQLLNSGAEGAFVIGFRNGEKVTATELRE